MTAQGHAPSIRRLEPSDWELLRTIRLAALEDSPMAFASTLAREEAFDEATWRSRCQTSCCLVADLRGDLLGTVSVIVFASGANEVVPWDDELPEDAVFHLVGMWVRPQSRRTGVGRELIESALAAARERGARQVELFVAEGNDPAQLAYEKAGFVPTGDTARLPHTPEVCEKRLVRQLD